MKQDRQIVIFLGGALAIAIILRLSLGPTLVAGTGDIYAVARGPDAMAAAVAVANAGDRALFPN